MTTIKQHTPDEWTINAKDPHSMSVYELIAVVKALREREYQTALQTQDAVASYRKHCGDRAVECAERDLLGDCLRAMSNALFHFDRTGTWHSDDRLMMRDILTKAGVK